MSQLFKNKKTGLIVFQAGIEDVSHPCIEIGQYFERQYMGKKEDWEEINENDYIKNIIEKPNKGIDKIKTIRKKKIKKKVPITNQLKK